MPASGFILSDEIPVATKTLLLVQGTTQELLTEQLLECTLNNASIRVSSSTILYK